MSCVQAGARGLVGGKSTEVALSHSSVHSFTCHFARKWGQILILDFTLPF